MSLSSINNPVAKFYASVMEDVLSSCRESFLDEGVDEQVMQELRQMWENKLLASKVLDPPAEEVQPPPLSSVQHPNPNPNVFKSSMNDTLMPSTSKLGAGPSGTMLPQQTTQQQQQQQQRPMDVTKLVPIQITLPPPAGSVDAHPKVFNIQVPSAALQTDVLQRIITGPIISATMALPTNIASSLLQQHVMAALAEQTQTTTNLVQQNPTCSLPQATSQNKPYLNQMKSNMTQLDGAIDAGMIENIDESNSSTEQAVLIEVLDRMPGKRKKKMCLQSGQKVTTKTLQKFMEMQLDGNFDTSDEDDDDIDDDIDDDDVDDDDDDNEDKEDEENEEPESKEDEEPLNSSDDVSDEDTGDLFETENVVVCQYDKINRARNKWKFYLKDGIMHVCGRDYVFQRANGDAEW